MKNNAKKTIAIISASAIGLSLAGCSSQVDKIDKCFDETYYDEALSLYKEATNMKPEEIAELTERMRSNLSEVISNFATGEVEYDSALTAIDSMISFNLRDLESDIVVARSQLKSLNASKECYTTGLKNLNDKHYLEAINCFSKVIKADCNYDDAQAKITDSAKLYIDSILEQKENLTKEHNFDAACNLMTTARNMVNQYDVFTSEQKENIQDNLDNVIFDYARFLADKNDYETALSIASSYQYEVNDTQGMNDLIKEIEDEYQNFLYESAKNEAINIAEAYAQDQAYAGAIMALDSLVEEYSSAASDSEIIDKRQEYENEYVDRMLKIGQKFLDDGKYLRAYRFLLDCSDFVSSEKFDHAISNIKSIKPIYLCEVKNQTADHYEEITGGDKITDTLGNEYYPADLNLFEIEAESDGWTGNNGLAEYYLGAQYDTLVGLVAVDDYSNGPMECVFRIKGDGATLFSLNINRKTIPTKVDIDVSSVQYLSFEIERNGGEGNMSVILSDFQFKNESN